MTRTIVNNAKYCQSCFYTFNIPFCRVCLFDPLYLHHVSYWNVKDLVQEEISINPESLYLKNRPIGRPSVVKSQLPYVSFAK